VSEQDAPPSGGRSDLPWPLQGGPDPSTDTAVAPPAAAPGDPGPGHHEATVPWVAGGAGTVPRYSNGRLVAVLAAIVAGVYFFGAYVFIVIGALFVSVVLHEFGHYWTARRTGMKATEFFIGFGPRIWSFRRGETEYGLKAIPAGAYVRIIGMNNLEEVDPADEDRTYRAKSAPKRMAVVLAGPGMNLLLAFVLLIGGFMIFGRPSADAWVIGTVGKDTAAGQIGLQSGDRVLRIDGDEVTTFEAFAGHLNEKAGKPVTLIVERDGQELTLQPTLGWRLTDASAAAIPSSPVITSRDLVVAVNGEPVPTYDDFRRVLTEPSGTATIRIRRLSNLYEVQVPLPLDALPEQGARGFLGVTAEPVLERPGPVAALTDTVSAFGQVIGGTVTGFGKLFSPAGLQSYAEQFSTETSTPPTSLSSGVLTPVEGAKPLSALEADPEAVRPVSIIGIVQAGSQTAEIGWAEFLRMFALVNIALAFINLIPLLPFDGGHAVIAAYEGVRGRIRGAPYRVDITRLLPVMYGVIFVFLLLGVSSMVLDITKPVSIGP
jgi:RIP metalloprotease RseP